MRCLFLIFFQMKIALIEFAQDAQARPIEDLNFAGPDLNELCLAQFAQFFVRVNRGKPKGICDLGLRHRQIAGDAVRQPYRVHLSYELT